MYVYNINALFNLKINNKQQINNNNKKKDTNLNIKLFKI